MGNFDCNTWDEFVGQETLKTRLRVHITGARKASRPLEHVLLTGPPGVGKTTIARLVGQEVGDTVVETMMPMAPRFLKRVVMEHQGILFLDEIHRGSKKQQEELLTLVGAEGGGYLQTPSGDKIYNHWLTVIGATTDPENVIPPLWDRFPIKPMYEPYTPDEMAMMVRGMAERAGVDLSDETCEILGLAANGLPRMARNLVKAARDLRDSVSETPEATVILELCGVRPNGLSEQHLLYLRSLQTLGGRAGLNVLTTLLRLHSKVVQDLERTLIAQGMIEYTPTGRELTSRGYKELKEVNT